MTNQDKDKCSGALYGHAIGDALAMPVHWYYDRNALAEDYGRVEDYMSPKNPHPDSLLWKSSYQALNPKGEILHDQAQYYGQKGVHYHQFLKAGENTLNVKISRLVMLSLVTIGEYDSDDFLKRYISFMITPGNHRDTYVEGCHRNFFGNYAKGLPPRQCGVENVDIGGLVGIVPIIVFYSEQPARARSAALEHLALTHPGPQMEDAGSLLVDLLLKVLNGVPLEQAIREQLDARRSPLLDHPFDQYLKDPDDWVIGPRFRTACPVEHSVPTLVHLALRYHDDPERALIVNTNFGGDNVHRGAVLGALLGAEHGVEGFPDKWVDGLLDPPPDLVSTC